MNKVTINYSNLNFDRECVQVGRRGGEGERERDHICKVICEPKARLWDKCYCLHLEMILGHYTYLCIPCKPFGRKVVFFTLNS